MGARYDEMIQATAREDATPGALLLVGVRSLLLRLTILAVFAGTVVWGSRGTSIDIGDPSEGLRREINQTGRLSPWVWVILAGVVIWALRRVVVNNYSEARALKLFDRIFWLSILGVVAIFVINVVWFANSMDAFMSGDYSTWQFLYDWNTTDTITAPDVNGI